jgi:hypothetical protein
MAGGRPKLIQDDGLERESNPVTRGMLREFFGDGKWRTIHDMVVVLMDRIPVQLAARAVLGSPKLAKKDLETQLRSGRRLLVRETVTSAVGSKVFEVRPGPNGREYRCVRPRPSRVKVGSRVLPLDLTKPAPSTQFGISRPQVYQVIAENPGIDFDELFARLLPCMIDDKIVTRYTNETIQGRIRRSHRGEAAIRAEVTACHAADPVAFLAKARLHLVRMLITDMVGDKQITEVRTFRVAKK